MAPLCKITLIYFDHQIRPLEEITLEKNLIVSYAEKYNLPLILKKIPVRTYAEKYKCSIETAGRQLRRRYWVHYAQLRSCQAVVTAHHLDDRCETFFHRIIRGTRSGLGSITAQENLTPALLLLRPLLDIPKKEILHFLEKEKMPFSLDSTNETLDYTRNKIRHQLLPIVETLNPAYRKSVASVCDYLDELTLYLTDKEAQLIEHTPSESVLDKKKFLALHPFEQKKQLFDLLKLSTNPESDKQIEHKHIELVLTHVPKRRSAISLPNGFSCIISPEKISLIRPFISQ